MEGKIEITDIFKVILIGDEKVGKTSFLNKFLDDTFDEKYTSTEGKVVKEFNAKYKNNIYKFNIWDCAGNEKNKGLGDGYYVGAKGAIIMFDAATAEAHEHVKVWKSDIQKVCGDIPIIIVLNKKNGRKENCNHKTETFCIINVENGINLSTPFQLLLQQLVDE